VEGATMGCVSINNREDEFALAQRTLTLQPLKPFDTKIFLYFIMSPHFQKMVSDNATGTAVAGIKSAKFRDLPMPLPPLSEQKEIVAMIDKLMSLCDDLEKQISLSSTHSTRLLNALLQEDLEN